MRRKRRRNDFHARASSKIVDTRWKRCRREGWNLGGGQGVGRAGVARGFGGARGGKRLRGHQLLGSASQSALRLTFEPPCISGWSIMHRSLPSWIQPEFPSPSLTVAALLIAASERVLDGRARRKKRTEVKKRRKKKREEEKEKERTVVAELRKKSRNARNVCACVCRSVWWPARSASRRNRLVCTEMERRCFPGTTRRPLGSSVTRLSKRTSTAERERRKGNFKGRLTRRVVKWRWLWLLCANQMVEEGVGEDWKKIFTIRID